MKKRILSSLLILFLLSSLFCTAALAAVDSQAPVIDEASLRLSKEAATVGETVTVSLTVTDNTAIDYIFISFWNLDSEEQLNLQYMTRVGESNVFEYEFVVTEYTPVGTWIVNDISAYDTTGNVASFSPDRDTYAFEVTDSSAPTVIDTEDIQIDKATAALGETVTVSIKVEGEHVTHVSFDLYNEVSGKGLQFLEMQYDDTTGRYTYSLTIDNTIPSGRWYIAFINAQDSYGHGVAEYVGRGEVGFTVTGTTADAEAPVIDNSTLSVSKSEIEHGESSVISVKITDNDEVGDVVLSIRNEETRKLLAYPAMTYNPQSGMHEYVFEADDTIPSGHWRLCSIHAHDVSGNLDLQNYFSWDYYILVKGENDHNYTPDAAVEATCQRPGLTEGSSCDICGKVLVAQEERPQKPHDFSDTTRPTCANCWEPNPDYAPAPKPILPPYVSPTIPAPSRPAAPTTKPADSTPAPVIDYADVPANAYYYDAVVWAVTNRIATGDTPYSFGALLQSSRADVIEYIWRAVGAPEAVSSAAVYSDVPAGSDLDAAVRWAVENGITNGMSETVFGTETPISRAQVVTFLWRLAGAPKAAQSMRFNDVADNAYYADAVNWAAANGITAGTGAGGFSPDDICTKAQIVTFLYRYFAQ